MIKQNTSKEVARSTGPISGSTPSEEQRLGQIGGEVRGTGSGFESQETDQTRGLSSQSSKGSEKEGARIPPVPGQTATSPAPQAPQVSMPRLSANHPGLLSVPANHPPLPMQQCPGGFYGMTTEINLIRARTAHTTGTRLSAHEVASNISLIRNVASAAQQGYLGIRRPLSAELILHWLDGQGQLLRWPSSRLGHPSIYINESLTSDAFPAFERGARERLLDLHHPQGSLLPAGTVRFMQWQGQGRCLPSGGRYGLNTVGADLGLSLGYYYAHSIVWIRASAVGRTTWDVEILRWCVQVYDIIDFNAGAPQIFPVPEAAYNDYLRRLGRSSPHRAVTVVRRVAGWVLLELNDDWFRDIEVSSSARKFLLYSDPFPAPTSIRQQRIRISRP